ncbi:MAG: CDGSH iron-sulfur domain-containing protein [Prochlorococcaceae cyanobacterium]
MRPEAHSPAAGPQALGLPAGRSYLCSCGRSRHGWICDGAHLGTGLIAREVLMAEPGTVLVCGCGRSRRFPLCDGSHDRPPRTPWWKWC